MRPSHRTAARPLVEELETRLTPAQVGANDFRLTNMGPDGNANYSTFDAAVAYNPTRNEYLVVWSGDDDTAPLVNDESEIFAQRVNASTGERLGPRIRVSDMGPNGDPAFAAIQPAVAYNPAANEYLVAWSGDDDTAPLVNDEFEIYGQRLDAVTGAEVGPNDFRISDMGGLGDSNYRARNPAVAYNSTNNEYLVVWEANDDQPGLAKFENEIWGQRLDAAGGQLGLNDFRVSDMGPDGSADFSAHQPAVAYNPAGNEYLVAWHGDDNSSPDLGNGETEIFGQRLSGAGAEIGVNDFRLSDMGLSGDDNSDAFSPAVAYNPAANEYLVVWEGDDNPSATTDTNDQEIFGQRFAAADLPPPSPLPSPQPAPPQITAQAFRRKGVARVRVRDAATGAQRAILTPFKGYRGRLRLALRDVTGDGASDLIVQALINGKRKKKVFDAATLAPLPPRLA